MTLSDQLTQLSSSLLVSTRPSPTALLKALQRKLQANPNLSKEGFRQQWAQQVLSTCIQAWGEGAAAVTVFEALALGLASVEVDHVAYCSRFLKSLPAEQKVALHDNDEPALAWKVFSRPNPNLRTPMYNYNGPNSKQTLGELYPDWFIQLEPRFVETFQKALLAHGVSIESVVTFFPCQPPARTPKL